MNLFLNRICLLCEMEWYENGSNGKSQNKHFLNFIFFCVRSLYWLLFTDIRRKLFPLKVFVVGSIIGYFNLDVHRENVHTLNKNKSNCIAVGYHTLLNNFINHKLLINTFHNRERNWRFHNIVRLSAYSCRIWPNDSCSSN